MSIATDVSRIKGNITAALNAIADKGVNVPAGSTSDALASLIASIEAGGGGAKVATGTFVPASDHTLSSVYKIEHNSGFIPDLCLVYYVSTPSKSAILALTGRHKLLGDSDLDTYGCYIMLNGSSSMGGSDLKTFPPTENIFYIRSIYAHKLYAGTTYNWIAIGGLA